MVVANPALAFVPSAQAMHTLPGTNRSRFELLPSDNKDSVANFDRDGLN